MKDSIDTKETVRVMQQALGELKQYRRQELMLQEPLAIIGMACRFPGGGELAEDFWQTLLEGKDTVTDVPQERWNIDDYYSPDPGAAGKTYSRRGAFIKDVDLFDAAFFGISPVEALAMDPQQRILLELSWRAFEHAGFLPQVQQETGVFVGVSYAEYAAVLRTATPDARSLPYYSTGNMLNAIPGRLAYLFGFTGPCMAVDTACSSSLVALHLACSSLRNGECRQAVIGGVNLQLLPDNTIAVSQSRMLSKDGRCKTFDASANGYVRGEGCGVIIVKRLSDAVSEGNSICAVIRGSAVNQDGTGSGFTVPSGKAQEKLMRQALLNAHADPSQIDYLEAHGTGTSLGDPIELSAVQAVYGSAAARQQPLWVGSVKTNIGHLEAAAGIAGVIKTALALRNRMIPAHLHFNQPSSHIPWDTYNIRIPVEEQSWPQHDRPAMAAVSSFGFSGVNAHVILEEAPAGPKQEEAAAQPPSYQLFTLSATSAEALLAYAGSFVQYLGRNPSCSLPSLCQSVQNLDRLLPYRLAVVTDSVKGLQERLETSFAGPQDALPAAESREDISVIWMFTGQGSQYPGMYKELYDTQAIFRDTVDQCAALVQENAGFELLEVTGLKNRSAAADVLGQTRYQQPCLFVLQYAMAKQLEAFGVRPDYLIGHSLGEYAAACLAGVMKLEDAIRLVAARGNLMQQLPAGGGMLALTLPDSSNVGSYIDGYVGQVSVAAINDPSQAVLSGRLSTLQVIAGRLAANKIPYRFLDVNQAFHSPLLAEVLKPFEEVLQTVSLHEPAIPMVSNLLGKTVQKEVTRHSYWLQHMMNPVLFSDGITYLEKKPGKKIWMELGPQPVLLSFVQNTVPGISSGDLLACIRRSGNNQKTVMELLGSLYKRGAGIHLKELYRHKAGGLTADLPGYPFQRRSYWPALPQYSPIQHAGGSGTPGGFNKEEVISYLQSCSLPSEKSEGLREIVDKIDIYLKQVSGAALPVFQFNLEPVEIKREPAASSQRFHGLYILLSGSKTFGKLAGALEAQGLQPVYVTEDTASFASEQHYIRYWDSEDAFAWKNVFEELESHFQKRIEGIIDLRDAEITDDHLCGNDEYSYAQSIAVKILHTAKQLGNCKKQKRLRFIFCSRQRHTDDSYGGEPGDIPRLVTGAICTVLQKELPQHDFVHLDLPLVLKENDWDTLLPCLLIPQTAQQLILRKGEWFTASIGNGTADLAPVASPATPLFHKQGTYLVTGASGAIGTELVDWMIRNGARHLVLVSRRGFDGAELEEKLASFRRMGASVHDYKADISDLHVAAALGEYLRRTVPLKGVFHAAGITDDDFLYRQDVERFKKVIKAKAETAWNLHELTKPFPLDYFVMFSSSASFMGLPGQGAYAAANAFLDGLMHYRRRMLLPALGVCWGPWQIGMAARMPDSYWDLLKENGVHPMAPSKAFHILGQLLARQRSAVYAVAEIDADLLSSQNKTDAPMPGTQASVTAHKEPQHHAALAQIGEMVEAVNYLMAYLRMAIEKIAGVSADQIREQVSLLTVGLDSLMTVRLQHSVAADTGLQLDIADVLRGASLHATAAQLAAQLPGLETSHLQLAPPVDTSDEKNNNNGVVTHTTDFADHINDLSEKEVDEWLQFMLLQK